MLLTIYPSAFWFASQQQKERTRKRVKQGFRSTREFKKKEKKVAGGTRCSIAASRGHQ